MIHIPAEGDPLNDLMQELDLLISAAARPSRGSAAVLCTFHSAYSFLRYKQKDDKIILMMNTCYSANWRIAAE